MAIETLIISVVAVIIVGSAFSFFVLGRKRKATRKIISNDIVRSMSSDGVEIQILESFSGIKGLAPLAFGGNNLNPKLILYEDHLEYKVLVRKQAYYSDIENLWSLRSRYYNKLRFTFNNRSSYFTAVFGNEETLQTVLNFLNTKGVRPDEKSRY